MLFLHSLIIASHVRSSSVQKLRMHCWSVYCCEGTIAKVMCVSVTSKFKFSDYSTDVSEETFKSAQEYILLVLFYSEQ